MPNVVTSRTIAHLPEPEQRTLRLIHDYLAATRTAVEWVLPQVFKVPPTVVREGAIPRRGRAESPLPMWYRATNDRVVLCSRFGRTEVLFNAGGRYDGFDALLLANHWRHDKVARDRVRTIDKLGAALDSLQSEGLVTAPRWEPYVGLQYFAAGVAEAVREWHRQS